MVSIVTSMSSQPAGGEPAWEIARLFPTQGHWDEADYLELDTNHLVEFTDGSIDVLAMPKPAHQRLVVYLFDELRQFIRPQKRGEALLAPMRIRLRAGKFREPDVMFMLAENSARKGKDYWDGADLVIEVVSDDAESRDRDWVRKRVDYAEAGIAEYWIVEPQEQKVAVRSLHRGQYTVHGEFGLGQNATSVLLAGFEVGVNELLAAARGDG